MPAVHSSILEWGRMGQQVGSNTSPQPILPAAQNVLSVGKWENNSGNSPGCSFSSSLEAGRGGATGGETERRELTIPAVRLLGLRVLQPALWALRFGFLLSALFLFLARPWGC